MKQALSLTVAAWAWIALAGCTFQPVQPVSPLPPVTDEPAAATPAAATPTPSPVAETGATPTPTPEAEAAGTPTPEEQAAMWARNVVAQQAQIDYEQVTVVSVEAVDWPDACLGVYNPDELCAAVITPGFLVIVDTPSGQYEVHTDAEGRELRIKSAPEANVGDVLVEWQGTDVTCRSLVVGRDGVAFGPCGGLQVPGKLVNPERAAELEDFVATFAPFEGDTPAGAVIFHGTGQDTANPDEQRMIAEWARLVALEAESGRGGTSWGLVLAWHREGGIAGFCDDLTVYVTGQAYAASCRRDPPATVAQRRLTADELARIYGWVDTLAGWEYREGDLAVADGMLVTVVFSGAGDAAATESDQQAVATFAQALFTEMTQ
jgi:hypothetical protein